LSSTGLIRIALLIAGLVIIAYIGSLFALTRSSFSSSPFQVFVTTPTAVLPTSTGEAAIAICDPDDQASACPQAELAPSQNLADSSNGVAHPAVSKDARPSYPAKYANDGLGDTSWVSNSAESWIKLDLGQASTISMVTLEKGNLDSSQDTDLGQFVIAVALSDVYADRDSTDDDSEYTPVFHSEQVDFSGTVSDTETISTLFSPVAARFVKITFERAGAAIEEIGVFMVELPGLAVQPTGTPLSTSTRPVTRFASLTSTSAPDHPPANTPVATIAPSQTPTNLPQPSATPIVLPTSTQPPANTPTPVPPTDPLPTLGLPTVEIPTVILSTETKPSGVTQSE
jgi:hypothetical protein